MELLNIMLSFLLRWIRYLVHFVQHWFRKRTCKSIVLDTGKRVTIGRQIAEGGYSFVFEAWDEDHHHHGDFGNFRTATTTQNPAKKYALKRVHCPDSEILTGCRREAAVHRSVSHPNLMPLLGMCIVSNDCYMLFPMASSSLRNEVNRRNPYLSDPLVVTTTTTPPWKEVMALQIFLRICGGVQTLHEHHYTHRDIKLENILLVADQPVLMDFGSAGPLVQTLSTRRHVLEICDLAAQHTTLPYRPPELLEGGVRMHDPDLDYTAVDVWSLGCTLFAILYGASPFECEFHPQWGIRITECTPLRILGNIPQPIPNTPVSMWYANEIRERLIEPMLCHDRLQRIQLPEVIRITEELIAQRGGKVMEYNSSDDEDGEHDGISLMSRVV
jgi:serine/threonine kinase 16